MTCDDCQAIVIDSSRGVEVDRALRDDARRHAALCSRCGEEQHEQQWLSDQLRAIAAADATRQAPARVEIAALAAWRAEYASANAPERVPDLIPIAVTSHAARRWLIRGVAWAGLAAAAMAALFVWPAWHGGSTGSSAPIVASGSNVAAGAPRLEGKQARARRSGSHVATVVGSSSASAKSSSAGTRAAHDGNSESTSNAAASEAPLVAGQIAAEHAVAEQPQQVTQPPASVTTPGAVRPQGVVLAERIASARVEPVSTRAAAATAHNTEFVALPYAEPLRSTEARHVMRVSMTSGDEMILGMLPSDRRTGQAFEADVLVGEDGIARAIRVIR